MLKKYVLIHNGNPNHIWFCDEVRKNEDFDIINWRIDSDLKSEYVSKKLQGISDFPSIADIENNLILHTFSIAEALKYFKTQIENKELAENNKMYSAYRKKRYEKEGLDAASWMKALIQKDVDEDSTEYDALVAKRAQIKLEIPKPVED